MEQFFLSQLFGSNGLLYAVFLAGMFAVVLFKREGIAIPGMFKLAYWLFAAAIVVPPCLMSLASAMMDQPFASVQMSGPRASDLGLTLTALYSGAGPVLFALSMLCAFGSMFPRKLPRAVQAPPGKHPLD